MYNLVDFSIFTRLCNRNHCLIPENFIIPPKNPVFIRSHSSFSPCPSPWQPVIYFPLLILDISSKWACIVCDLFHKHSVLKVHLCCSVYQYFIPFCYNIPFCGYITFCLFSSWWAFELFLLWLL